MMPDFPGCAPGQTGRALFVEKVSDLDKLKTGVDPKVIYVDRPVVFTHQGILDLKDCHFVYSGGSLHGWSAADQLLTASTLGAVPFITARGFAVLENLTIVGVQIAFDFNGSTTPNAYVFMRFCVVTLCTSLGTITGYSFATFVDVIYATCGGLTFSGPLGSVTLVRVAFALMGGPLVFQGSFTSIALETCIFEPKDGVTAVSMPASPQGAVITTFDVKTCLFFLEFAAAVGIAIADNALVAPEGIDITRAQFINSSGGAPIGIPIPSPGYFNADSNEVHIARAKGTPNSKTVSVVTMANNPLATSIGAPNTPVRAALTGVISQRASKFINSTVGPTIGRIIFDGGIDETIRVEFKVTIIGGNNKVMSLYIAEGDALTPAVVALETVQPATTNAGGKAAPVVVGHIVDFTAGAGGFIELWVASADGSDPTVEGYYADAIMLPA